MRFGSFFPVELLSQTCYDRVVFSVGSYGWSLIAAFSLNIINKDHVFCATNQLLAGLQQFLVREGERCLKAVVRLLLPTEYRVSFRAYLKLMGGILLISLGFGSEVVES